MRCMQSDQTKQFIRESNCVCCGLGRLDANNLVATDGIVVAEGVLMCSECISKGHGEEYVLSKLLKLAVGGCLGKECLCGYGLVMYVNSGILR